ncbi:MAG: zinc ribbon domain-containing protein [Chloroflexota bacterium]
MSERSQHLLELQRLDTESGRLSRQVQQAEAGLADHLKERAAARAIQQAEQALQARQREQRDREFELASLEARIKDHEQRLYSGKGSPRDLQALQRDIEHDQQRRGELEEQALAAMDATEAARSEVDRIKTAAERVLSEASAEQRKLGGERAQSQADLDRLTARRAQVAAALDAPSLALYDRLRQRMPDGVAVAEITQGRCEGCRTTLPSAEIQRARRAETPVPCSACGRILHVPHA